MQTLVLAAQAYKSCGAGCTQSVGDAQRAEGASPLALAVAGLEAPAEAEGLWLSVHVPLQVQQSPVLAGAQTEQDFSLSGTLASRSA
jgi:hypothetical protein